MSERSEANISGLWMGSYSYPSGAGPTTPFLASIEDHDGSLTGSIMEPNTMGASSTELQSFIAGARQGFSIDFTKTYDGGSDAAHAVDYVGRLSADGNVISGMWSLGPMDGSFEMRREAVWEQVEGEEAEVVGLE